MASSIKDYFNNMDLSPNTAITYLYYIVFSNGLISWIKSLFDNYDLNFVYKPITVVPEVIIVPEPLNA